MKDFSDPSCAGSFAISGFSATTKTPVCQPRDVFMKSYFATQNAVVPGDYVVTGFSPTGTLLSTSASGIISSVFASMPDA